MLNIYLTPVLLILLAAIQNSMGLAPIIVDLIPMSNENRPGRSLTGQRYITVHNTNNASPGANAEAHGNYIKRPSTRVSWHYTVDDHEIYQHLPINEVGWHTWTTKGNLQSIGIEICENSDGNFERAVENAQKLIAKLMVDLDVPISRVVAHQQWSNDNCPHLLLDRWTDFIAGIGGGNSDSCYGSVRKPNGLNINTLPYSSTVVLGFLPDRSYVELKGRVMGSPVGGNPYWFRLNRGYIPGHYIQVSGGSARALWCNNEYGTIAK